VWVCLGVKLCNSHPEGISILMSSNSGIFGNLNSGSTELNILVLLVIGCLLFLSQKPFVLRFSDQFSNDTIVFVCGWGWGKINWKDDIEQVQIHIKSKMKKSKMKKDLLNSSSPLFVPRRGSRGI
jgi:hypothetical protein